MTWYWLSAVEGVQAQTRVLTRALQWLRIPTPLLINRIDRAGADDRPTLHAISQTLMPSVVAMGADHELGTRAAGVTRFSAHEPAFRAALCARLAEHDDSLLAAFVGGGGCGRRPLAQRRVGPWTG